MIPFFMQHIRLVQRTNSKDFIPCVVYGKNSFFTKNTKDKPYCSYSLSISASELKILKNKKLKARTLPLKIDFEDDNKHYNRIVILKDLQFHPIHGNITHLDFLLVDNLESFETLIPIMIIGKENSIAIKEGATVNQMFKQIKATRTHSSTTDEIILDVSNLKKKDVVRVNDIQLIDISIKNNPVLLTII